jgi:cell division protease FtsH
MLGGRAAEQLIYGDTTTGAESDLEQATRIARAMVGRFGMSSRVGPVSVLPGSGQEQPFGGDPNGPSPATRQLVDDEVRRILEECDAVALDLLARERDRLEQLSEALLEAETLDAVDAYAAAGLPLSRPSREADR